MFDHQNDYIFELTIQPVNEININKLIDFFGFDLYYILCKMVHIDSCLRINLKEILEIPIKTYPEKITSLPNLYNQHDHLSEEYPFDFDDDDLWKPFFKTKIQEKFYRNQIHYTDDEIKNNCYEIIYLDEIHQKYLNQKVTIYHLSDICLKNSFRLFDLMFKNVKWTFFHFDPLMNSIEFMRKKFNSGVENNKIKGIFFTAYNHFLTLTLNNFHFSIDQKSILGTSRLNKKDMAILLDNNENEAIDIDHYLFPELINFEYKPYYIKISYIIIQLQCLYLDPQTIIDTEWYITKNLLLFCMTLNKHEDVGKYNIYDLCVSFLYRLHGTKINFPYTEQQILLESSVIFEKIPEIFSDL